MTGDDTSPDPPFWAVVLFVMFWAQCCIIAL